MRILFLHIACFLCLATTADAQQFINDSDEQRSPFSTDSVDKESVPIGLFSWKIEERFGDILPAPVDTVPHFFQNSNVTEGLRGEYNTTGNLGSPRIHRIFSGRELQMNRNQFIFTNPYDFFLTEPGEFLFTNTKSPYTNLTYHTCGNNTNGEDRIRAYFVKNAGKRVGMGFKLDYLYGRGYYDQQSTAEFNGALFGYYTGDRYQMHLLYSGNEIKNTENGGIEDDSYVTEPESFSAQYKPADMPVRLIKTWNKMHLNTVYLTQRYNLGFTRYYDKDNKEVAINKKKPNNAILEKLGIKSDSIAADSTKLPVLQPDSLAKAANADSIDWNEMLASLRQDFVPVAGFIHTLRMDFNKRNFTDNDVSDHYYEDWYLQNDSALDVTRFQRIENTLAFEISEGFNKWAKAGMRIFAKHELDKFTLPDMFGSRNKYNYNYFTVGAQLFKREGEFFHFNALGELRTTGTDWGEFNIEAQTDFNIPLKKDTLRINLDGYVRNENPSFYYRHYHGRNAWWDNSLNKMMSANVNATLSYKKTRLNVSLHSIQNYTYFRESTNGAAADQRRFGVQPMQAGRNVQVLCATLFQDFKWGIFHWDNALTYQASSSKEALPLPAFNAYSNIYLKFRIAKVLLTELGGDIRYFTRYYAPAYSPIIGQYVVQDRATRIKTGNYPIVNAYVNFHLKRCRFYVVGSHVNHSSGVGFPFLTPHYPINRFVLRFGISWNFFN